MSINVVNSSEYKEVLSQLNIWYGQDAPKIVDIINQYELTPEQVTESYLTGSGFEPWYTSGGSVGGYNTVGSFASNASAGSAAAELNSNIGTTSQVGVKTAVETGYNQAGKLTASQGLTSVATGAKSALTFVSKEVLPAVSAAGLGISLGKTIDSALYNLNPDFWDNIGMSTLNPETWNTITQDYPDGTLKRAFNTVFGLNPNTGETQQYLDQSAAAYLAMYMQGKGVFDSDTTVYELDNPTLGGYTMNITPVYGAASFVATDRYDQSASRLRSSYASSGTAIPLTFRKQDGTLQCIWIGTEPFTVTDTYRNASGSETHNAFGPATYDGISTYSYTLNIYTGNYIDGASILANVPAYAGDLDTASIMSYLTPRPSAGAAGGIFNAIIVNGTTKTEQHPVEGIGNQEGATLPNFSGCATPEDYLQALKNQYPDLFNNAVTQTVANPDGTTSTTTYIPIGTPSKNNNGNKTQPVTDANNSGNTQDDSKASPDNMDLTGLENLIKTLTDTISKTGQPKDIDNPDPTGSGTTPPVVTPTGQASALFAIYNPSQAQLNSFGAWLWSSNFIDQVLKLFNNPMQAIIGLHKIFAAPAISGAGNIRVGYLDSGVGANLVGAQYTSVDCGSVKVSEEFGNVFDYTDTHIRLYLPFIGIVDLDTADVMRGTVGVKYHVDVITGACLAEVRVSRDGSGGTLYQYAGDASVRYPISSGSYMGIVSGVLSAVGGIASAVMTGGATLPLAAGAVAGGISGARTQVQHSGNFSGNAGAMGAKKPYLIIERPQTAIADGYTEYQGKGANAIRAVSAMSGYFKMTDVHTDSISGAAESELDEIKTALERGVIK